jgi:hypothetical protein
MKVKEIWRRYDGQVGARRWAMVDATHQIKQKRDEEHLEHLLAPFGRYCHSCLRHAEDIEAGACFVAIEEARTGV